MKRILAKIGVLGLIFAAAVYGFSAILNREETENVVDQREASLPVMYMEVSGNLTNRMFGHREPLEEEALRESLTPLSTDREIAIAINPYQSKIKSITYEVHSVGGDTLIENSRIGNLKEDGDLLRASFSLEHSILMNQEYTLMFIVDIGGGKTIYYYTRLIQRAGVNTEKYLEFVQMFYQKALDKRKAAELTAYIEPNDTVTNSSFHEVNIHSSFDQLSWGTMNPELVQSAVPMIREMNETTTSISQNYIISAKDEEGHKEYYTVTEFYRMRYAQPRVRLLDFERKTEQIFDGNLPVLTSKGLNLGIVGKDAVYVRNPNADIVAFVQAGELWTYNRSANKAVRVFSFRGGKTEERNEYQNHNIKIARVTENGDVTFVVYGYMNRGEHEGRSGIAVYYYSAERNLVQEEIFIPDNRPYEMMQQDFSRLIYRNRKGILYFLRGDSLYQVNTKDGETKVIKEHLNPDTTVVSKSQASVAWLEPSKGSGSNSAVMMNLEDGTTRKLLAPTGEKLQVQGFINEDLVYGLANEEDILTDAAGKVTFGMNSLQIVNFAGETVREYKKDRIYITDVSIQEGLLNLQRAERTENGFVETDSDVILNNLQEAGDTVSVHLTVNERRKTQVVLEFTKAGKTRNLLSIESKYLDTGKEKEVTIETEKPAKNLYYVYGGGKLIALSRMPAEAITLADEHMGVVLNSSQGYLWERGNQKEHIRISTETLPQPILDELMEEAPLQAALGEEYQVLNLSGCTLDQVLYQVSQSYPVLAKKSDGSVVVIVGYDKFNTWVYDAETQQVTPIGLQDSHTTFGGAGNIYLSYVEKPLDFSH